MKIFIGIPIVGELKNEIAKNIEKFSHHPSIQHLKWIKPDNLHLTLYFIGEITEGIIPQLKRSLQAKLSGVYPANNYCKKVIILPSEKYPKALSYYVNPSAALIKINAQVKAALKDFHFKKKYPFLPHITIARIQASNEFKLNKEITLPKSELKTNEVIIYESRSTRNGVEYIPLETIPIPPQDANL